MLFQGFAGSVAPSYNIYGGGNGTANQFWFAYPCLQGSETVTNGGSACTYNASPSGQTQYSYLLTQTINGSTYVSGIQFGSAPSNGNAILASYTKLAGMQALLGANAHCLNAPQYFEINSSGALQTNGGFCALASTPVVGTIASPKSVTGISSNTLTDSTLTPTLDQYAGYCIGIVSDSVTPTAVGQIQCINGNSTGGVFSVNTWTVTPSTSAKYVVLASPMQTNTHPSTSGHLTIAQGLRTNNPALFPY